MVLTIQFQPDVEAGLREALARGDTEMFARLLVEAVGPAVQCLLRETAPEGVSVEEFDRILGEIDEEMDAYFGGNVPVLPERAITRQGIYGDHL